MNDVIAAEVPRDKQSRDRHYSAVSVHEVWSWITQRIELSLDIKLSIEDAYNSVMLLRKLLLFQDCENHVVPYRKACRNQAGCRNTGSSLLMVR